MSARVVIAVLAGVVRERGAPAGLRSDNGLEFIAKALWVWLAAARIETLYIEPGAPWENGYAESFNSKLRDEFLEGEEFQSVLGEGTQRSPASQCVGVSDARGVRGDVPSGRLRKAYAVLRTRL